jgi:glycosyltransferase involved in cell wall biosynthesis
MLAGQLRFCDGKSIVIKNISNYLSKNRNDVILVCDVKSENVVNENQYLKIVKIRTDIERKYIFSHFILILTLYKICKNYNIGLVHTHQRYHEFISNLLRSIIKIKTITTVHSLVANFKLFSFKSNHIAFVSEYLHSELKRKFNFSRNSSVIKNGIDFRAYKFETISKNFVSLLFVGRIDYEKGVDILLKAFLNLKEEYPDLKLNLVGEFSPIHSDYSFKHAKNFKQEILDLIDISESITIKKSELIPWSDYSNADIVVIPSRVETFSLVAAEAAYCKKPMICSKIGALEEMFSDGIGCLFFETGSVSDLTEKIAELINSENKRREYGERAHSIINNQYSIDKMMDKYLELYSTI